MKPRVFIYAPGNKEMIDALKASATNWEIVSFGSLSELVAKAALPLCSQDTLLVVSINNQDNMNDLDQFLAGSLDFDLVLLIEDDQPALAQAALAARPRMVFSGKLASEDLAAVLERMHPRMVQRSALLSA